MTFISKKIQTMFVSTPKGEVALSGKAGEDPEIKPNVGEIEDADDGLTNDGQMIVNYVVTRSYIQGVFGYKDEDQALIKSCIDAARTSAIAEVPVNCVFTDGSIGSNKGTFVGAPTYNGTGTIELKFACAQDWIFI
jgi:hypothetical protein